MELFNAQGAAISSCGKYRWTLYRTWSHEKPKVMFICLNPSTANADIEDATTRRLRTFAHGWGFGGYILVNLFAFRATDPEQLKHVEDPIGRDNDVFIKDLSPLCSEIVFAWGTNGSYKGRDKQVIARFPNAKCIDLSKDGHPKHPLYLKGDLKLKPFMA